MLSFACVSRCCAFIFTLCIFIVEALCVEEPTLEGTQGSCSLKLLLSTGGEQILDVFHLLTLFRKKVLKPLTFARLRFISSISSSWPKRLCLCPNLRKKRLSRLQKWKEYSDSNMHNVQTKKIKSISMI